MFVSVPEKGRISGILVLCCYLHIKFEALCRRLILLLEKILSQSRFLRKKNGVNNQRLNKSYDHILYLSSINAQRNIQNEPDL